MQTGEESDEEWWPEGTPVPDEDFDTLLKKLDDHPVFAKKVDMDNLSEDMEALMALKYADDDSLEDQADTYKDEGNHQFQLKCYRYARDNYTKGITLRCEDRQLNCVLYSNRAAASFRLKNYRSAAKDCVIARKFNPKHMKAIMKGAEAFVEVNDFNHAISWCDDGLAIDSINTPLIDLRAKANKLKKTWERDQRKGDMTERRREGEEEKVFAAIKSRGIKLQGSHKLSDLEPTFPGVPPVHLDSQGLLHWPVLLMYPQHKETDIVQDVAEDHSLSVHLQQVLSDTGPPPPWDPERQFAPNTVQIFFENTVEEKLYEVDPSKSLKDIISHEKFLVMGGTPSFIVLLKGAPFTKVFLERYS